MFTGTGWWGDVLALVLYSVLGVPASIWVFRQALRLAQRSGTLSQY